MTIQNFIVCTPAASDSQISETVHHTEKTYWIMKKKTKALHFKNIKQKLTDVIDTIFGFAASALFQHRS